MAGYVRGGTGNDVISGGEGDDILREMLVTIQLMEIAVTTTYVFRS